MFRLKRGLRKWKLSTVLRSTYVKMLLWLLLSPCRLQVPHEVKGVVLLLVTCTSVWSKIFVCFFFSLLLLSVSIHHCLVRYVKQISLFLLLVNFSPLRGCMHWWRELWAFDYYLCSWDAFNSRVSTTSSSSDFKDQLNNNHQEVADRKEQDSPNDNHSWR